MMIILILLLLTPIYTQNCNQGCFECDPSSKDCRACLEGYSLTISSTCTKNVIENCRVYLSDDVCFRCIPTYDLVDNACVKDYSGCLQYVGQNQCQQCMLGQTLTNGKCQGTLNCKQKTTNCQQCDSDFTLKNNKCQASSSTCSKIHSPTGSCTICQEGYSLMGFRCVYDLLRNRNCYLSDQYGLCMICKDGYLKYKGNCLGLQQAQLLGVGQTSQKQQEQVQNNLSNAPEQKQQNFSASQQNTFQKANSSIKQNTQIIKIEPQIKQNENLNTPQHHEPQIQTNQFAKTNILCKKMQDDKCISCYRGYFLDNNNCHQISVYCESFIHQSKRCQNCYRGYILTEDNHCILVRQKLQDPRCKVFYADSTCKTCYPHFHVKNGICVESNPLCRTIDQEGKCVTCYPGYHLTQGNCLLIDANPALFDPFCIKKQGFACLTCVGGYYVNHSGFCEVLDVKNCQSYSKQNGNCMKCLGEYVLLQNKCHPAVEFCQGYNEEGYCGKCQNGYFLKKNRCYQDDVTCSEINDDGSCKTCVSTYTLFKGKCIFPSLGLDKNCDSYKNSYCQNCNKGYLLINFRCYPIDPNCIEFDYKVNRCKQCEHGMRVYGLGCL